jgi:hypothetical protein
MTLCYTPDSEVPARLRKWAGRNVEWRNGALFSTPERRAEVVYTDDPEIRAAYEEQGAEVKPLPTGRYVPEEGEQGWVKVKDTQTGEYVEGASKRSMEDAQLAADKLNES